MNIRRQSGDYQFEKDLFSKGARGFRKIYHEVSSLMIFLQTNPSVKNMNISYYDLYYTVNKNRNENEVSKYKY